MKFIDIYRKTSLFGRIPFEILEIREYCEYTSVTQVLLSAVTLSFRLRKSTLDTKNILMIEICWKELLSVDKVIRFDL